MKKLKRSKDNRMLAGVCGGIGEYLGIDPTIIRIAAVLATLVCLGTIIVIYIILIFIIPLDDGIIDV